MCRPVILLLSLLFVLQRLSASGPANNTFCEKSLSSLLSDCSFMLDGEPNVCQIHHRNSCMTYDFTSWDMAPIKEIASLDALEYVITLTTYSHSYKQNDVLALNISLSASSAEVHGFSYSLLEYHFPHEQKRYNSCRIFDFRKFHRIKDVTLFYDCYFNILGDHNNKFFSLTTRTLPTNHVATFYVSLSTSPKNLGGETVCSWESTVMTLLPALTLGNVELLFSAAREDLKIKRYRISLIRHTTAGEHEEYRMEVVPATSWKGFHMVKIPDVKAGKYHIEIHPVHPNWNNLNCSVTATDSFIIPHVESTSTTVAIAIAVVSLIMLFVASIMWIIYRRIRPRARRMSQVFLLYSYDDEKHYHMVKAFYSFLCAVPGLDVVFDVEQANVMGVPHRWLFNNLTKVNHIILVISSGVYKKAQDGFKAEREHHPWGDHVEPAVMHIVKNSSLHDRLVKVTFSDTADSRIPPAIQSKGHTFRLPRHLNRFLHHLFNESCRAQVECIAKHPVWYTNESEKALATAIQQRYGRMDRIMI